MASNHMLEAPKENSRSANATQWLASQLNPLTKITHAVQVGAQMDSHELGALHLADEPGGQW